MLVGDPAVAPPAPQLILVRKNLLVDDLGGQESDLIDLVGQAGYRLDVHRHRVDLFRSSQARLRDLGPRLYCSRLAGRSRERSEIAGLADAESDLLQADPEVLADPSDFFDVLVEIDLSALEPYIVGPHTPDRVRPASRMGADVRENGYPEGLSAGLIGSCTNSSYEDMSRAADVARQAAKRGASSRVTLWVSPGSEQIHQTIGRDGQIQDLEAIGATVLANACGPCIGQWKRDDVEKGESNSILSSYNRNFPKRNDGNPETLSFISSPEVVIAYALAGTLDWSPLDGELEAADGSRFKLDPPAPAPEIPPQGFVISFEGYQAPAEASAEIAVDISPESQRLQRLTPFAAWDGGDMEGLPLLLKARGKCTTDHISMAGPWLRFRGHLDNISDNMFIGAVNAFTGDAGTGLDQLSGERGVAFPAIARHYKAEGARWVVVGDENYGEGSSREHAAMSPRHLGAGAVITRSFARIHESNLKKQGVLPLTFSDPGDYEKVLETDRVSLRGLDALAPDTPLAAVLQHEDGSEEAFEVEHTLNDEQIAWFRAGSALNLLRDETP